MTTRSGPTNTRSVLATTKHWLAAVGVAILVGGVGIPAGVATASAEGDGNDNTPVSSYPADPTWPAPPNWGSYPAAASWPAPPNWGSFPASSTWPGTSSHPCCSR